MNLPFGLRPITGGNALALVFSRRVITPSSLRHQPDFAMRSCEGNKKKMAIHEQLQLRLCQGGPARLMRTVPMIGVLKYHVPHIGLAICRFKPKSFIAGHRANFVFKSGLGRIATANLLLHLLTKYENAGIDSDCIEYN